MLNNLDVKLISYNLYDIIKKNNNLDNFHNIQENFYLEI